MSELKTLKTDASVDVFIDGVDHPQRRADALELLTVFEEATGMKPAMWGESIIGYGQYHYKSERSNQEGDWPLTGFSPRKANMTVYIMPGFDSYKEQLARLGKYKTSVSCIYINKLSDVDTGILAEIIRDSVQRMQEQSPATASE